MFGTAVGPASAESPADQILDRCGNYVPNPTAESSTQCSGLVFVGRDLSSVNLAYANLTGANLASVNLTNANLTYANLTGADLTYNMDLTNADLTGANLTNAALNSANLTGAKLSGANLTDVNLNGATLTGSSVIPADITVPATSAAGAPATWTTPAVPTGLAFGGCTRASEAVLPGSVFDVGETTVTCTVTSMRYGYQTAGSGTFTVTVTPYLEAPSFIDPPAGPLTAVAGTPFTHTITVAGSPDPTLTTTGLPEWLDLVGGVLSGTPPAAGSFPFTLTADNGVGTPATLRVTVTVDPTPAIPEPPTTGSLGSLLFFGSLFVLGSAS